MRLRLFGLLAVVPLAFLTIGQSPRPRAVARDAETNPPTGFEPPVVVLDGAEHGTRVVPHFADFDGDGTTDLLVGVRDRLLVYRNLGTNRHPAHARPVWFDDTEPSARLPAG